MMTRIAVGLWSAALLGVTPLHAQRPRPDVALSAGAIELYRQTGLLVHGAVVWPLNAGGHQWLGIDAAVGSTSFAANPHHTRRYVHVGMRYEQRLTSGSLQPFLGARAALARNANSSWAFLTDTPADVRAPEDGKGDSAIGAIVGALAGVRIRLSPKVGLVSTASLDYLRLYEGQSTSRSWSWTAGLSFAQ